MELEGIDCVGPREYVGAGVLAAFAGVALVAAVDWGWSVAQDARNIAARIENSEVRKVSIFMVN